MIEEMRAADIHRSTLHECLEFEFSKLLDRMLRNKRPKLSEIELILSESIAGKTQTSILRPLLTAKGAEFNSFTKYLKDNKLVCWAQVLEGTWRDPEKSVLKRIEGNLIEKFIAMVTRFHETMLPFSQTLSGASVHINQVWIPVELRNSPNSTKLGYSQLVSEIERGTFKTILISGDSGFGKSVLIKKIAYDLAGKHAISSFRLVLAAPLAKLREDRDILEAIIEYYLDINNLDLDDRESADLITSVRELGSNLLICLDGIEDSGKFKKCFRSSLDSSSVNATEHRYLITYRNCDTLALDDYESSLKLEIMTINESTIEAFVSKYCCSNEIKEEIMDFCDKNQVPYNIPRFLSYICYLAQLTPESLHKLTSTYCSFFRQILTGKARNQKLKEPVNVGEWKQCDVVRSTASLAFWGSEKKKWLFNRSELIHSQISDESFKYGFLCYTNTGEVEFPHRSFQDFFAAIHLFLLIESKSLLDATTSLVLNLCRDDTQIGRFFFGILSRSSETNEFERISDSICQVVLETKLYMVDYLISLSKALIDCTAEQNKYMGRQLRHWIDEMIEKIRKETEERDILWNYGIPIGIKLTNYLFCEGLETQVEENREKTARQLFVGNNLKSIEFCRIVGRPTELEAISCNRVSLLVWFWRGLSIDKIRNYFSVLPHTTHLILRTEDICDREVVVSVNYEPFNELQVKQFSFGFRIAQLANLSRAKNGLSFETSLTICGQNVKRSVSWIAVNIEKKLSQQDLITALIQISLKVCRDAENFEIKVNQEKPLRTLNRPKKFKKIVGTLRSDLFKTRSNPFQETRKKIGMAKLLDKNIPAVWM